MRQGNGSDLLGANDPRSATIGVIYVAPNDDRESVLAAILTQEKLGRKQIAIVLPAQNKAFQRFIDFEGLKNMRRKLQAQLIIVAPQGSSPAEFARQRRFTFFSSLESYGRSLRDESDASRSVKRGWFGGRGGSKPGNDDRANDNEGIVPIDPQPHEFPANNDEELHYDERHESAHPNPILPLAAGAGAGFIAGQELHSPEDDDTLEPLHFKNQINAEDDELDLPPSPQAINNIPDDEENIQILPPLPLSMDYEDDESEDVEDDMVGADDDESTAVIAPVPVPLSEPDEEPEEQGAISPIPMRQTTGKRPVVAGVPYQAAGGGTMGYGVGGSAVSPTTGNTGGSGRRRSGWQLFLLGLVALLLLTLLFCGGIALATPGTLGSAFASLQQLGKNVVGGGTPSATVTITPKRAALSNTYVVTSTFGTPDPSKRQIEARPLAFTTQPQSKTVPATGKTQTPGTRATGTISFYNSSTSDFYVAANNTFTDARGIVIATDSLVRIPAGNPNLGTYGHATASAHAVNVGVSGNLPAGDITNLQCCGDPAVGVTSTGAFTGGQDPQNFTAVQQSDVDNAANPLKPALLQSALTTLNSLKHAGEQYVSNPSCKTNVTPNPGVGAKATSVTVSVTATCSAEAYDQVGAETIAANLLKAEADKDTGGGYGLSGTITTSNAPPTVDSKGNVTLLVKASGTWMYQITPTLKTSLAKLIAGKSKNEATTLLLQQPGISTVAITIVNGTTLPTDYTQISIVVPSSVPGTPTAVPGSPTPTVPNVTPTHIPTPRTTPPVGGGS